MTIKITMTPIDAALPWITVAPSSLGLGDRVDYETTGSATNLIDATTINAAYQAAKIGSSVYLFPGRYFLNASILVDRFGVSIQGAGMEFGNPTELVIGANVPAIIMGGASGSHTHKTTIRGFGIQGAGGGSVAQHGILVEYAEEWTVDDVWVRGVGGDNIRMGGTGAVEKAAYYGLITGSFRFETAGQYSMYFGSGASVITVIGGHVRTATLQGVYAFPDGGPTTAAVTFFNTTFQSATRASIRLNGCYGWSFIGGYWEVNGNDALGDSQIEVGIAGGNINYGTKLIGGYITGTGRDNGLSIVKSVGGQYFPGFIRSHDVRNIDVAAEATGNERNEVSFEEVTADLPVGASASRNLGGATKWTNLAGDLASAKPAFLMYGPVETKELTVDGRLYSKTVTTFDDLDATPTVNGNNEFTASNTGATSITAFDNGVAGQSIRVLFTNGNTTLVDGASLQLQGGINFNPQANTVMTFTMRGAVWYEAAGRSVN